MLPVLITLILRVRKSKEVKCQLGRRRVGDGKMEKQREHRMCEKLTGVE